jgi:hypothetical protein
LDDHVLANGFSAMARAHVNGDKLARCRGRYVLWASGSVKSQRSDQNSIFNGADLNDCPLRWIRTVGATRLNHLELIRAIKPFVISSTRLNRTAERDKTSGDSACVRRRINSALYEGEIFCGARVSTYGVTLEDNLRRT